MIIFFEILMLIALSIGLLGAVIKLFEKKSTRSAEIVEKFLMERNPQSDEEYASQFPYEMRDCSIAIRHIIAKECGLPVERIYPTDIILDIAIPCSDGLDMVSIIREIEKEFDFRFPSPNDDKEVAGLMHIFKLTERVFLLLSKRDNNLASNIK